MDGDSVPDVLDNCPGVFNSGQRDEDMDGVGSACDLCPMDADPMQANGDGDEVGDACDPRPTLPGDRIWMFDSFHSLSAGWSQDGGTWSIVSPENLVRMSSNSATGTRLRFNTPEPSGPFMVVARYTFTSLGTPSPGAGIILDTNAAGNGVACATLNLGTTASVSVLTLVNGGGGAQPFQEAFLPALFTTQVPYTLKAYRDHASGTVRCTLGDVTSTMMSNASGGFLGLRTNRAATDFSAVVVYELGGPIP